MQKSTSTQSHTRPQQSEHEALTIIQLEKVFGDKKIKRVETVQSLWSGYGEIARYAIDKGALEQTVIVKLINPTGKQAHPRNWDGDISHARKLSSYKNEALFYSRFSSLTNSECKVPKLLGEWPSGLVMEDLDAKGFNYRTLKANTSLVTLGLKWLANFHAAFLGESTTGLWPIGTYWHLATRPNEWEGMEDSELKQAARAIDEKLNNAHITTLVHGDAKIANFCITEDQSDLAAVDFQYVGAGVGVKDVIYFLGSCMTEAELYSKADEMTQLYFSHLRKALKIHHKSDEVIDEWRNLLPFAWADFERFLMGWSPQHHKLTGYSAEQTRIALSKI